MKTNLPMKQELRPRSGFLLRSVLFKIFLFVAFFAVGFSANAQAVKDFTTKLNSASNKAVAGASIQNVNKLLTATSTQDGSFTIKAATGDSLKITASGYKTMIYIVLETPPVAIELTALDEVTVLQMPSVQRIYTTVPAALDVSSNAAIYSPDIVKSPVTSFTNAVTGRLAGLYTLQSTGLPGADAASFTLRGQTPLVVVDGVVVPSLYYFDLEEIESITVQKDAIGTAMLGVRGSHGAIIVTTKKGKEGQQRFSFTAQTAVQQAIGFPKTLNAYDYARLHNEAFETMA